MVKTLFSIFLLDVDFDKSINRLKFLLIFFMLTEFLKDKKINSYVINQMFKF